MIITLGILVGLALGLTGGGGSIFAVPLLVYVVGMPVHAAIAVSLATVAVTSLFGAAEGVSRGLVEIRAGLIVAVAGMVTAPLGILAGDFVDERWLLTAFGMLTIIVAVRMGRAALRSPENTNAVRSALQREPEGHGLEPCQRADSSEAGGLRLRPRCVALLASIGGGVGVISGFFGVGGGFLVVPFLVRLTRLGMHRAVGTSLLVIGCTGMSGLFSALVVGRSLDMNILYLFLGGSLVGMFLGRRVARYLAGATLQLLFAIALVAIGALILVTRAHGALG
ncbi:sulfite exporter TauE/SafE family protein [Salinisphaera sp. USBA-960]|uniref:sulfite exporter TauE/SafE family protein n=1 Tax=Salinisphaera orenii TaxID=856731 RepID=UPI000DBE77EE|nr:sulfite exporter TauE/SafE family protein [Salifodinibacter halophilus]NNC25689.1 sulfite exporter TauE/SafE family protein [Salifodinibacter halophilus]